MVCKFKCVTINCKYRLIIELSIRRNKCDNRSPHKYSIKIIISRQNHNIRNFIRAYRENLVNLGQSPALADANFGISVAWSRLDLEGIGQVSQLLPYLKFPPFVQLVISLPLILDFPRRLWCRSAAFEVAVFALRHLFAARWILHSFTGCVGHIDAIHYLLSSLLHLLQGEPPHHVA